jgi:serine phosphatase RsbU (regulator of sigma subunit)
MAIVGDVAGQGAEAAALTAQARHTLRTAAMLTGDPVAAVEHLNAVLTAGPELSLCTVCVVALPDPGLPAGTARVVCAGHPRPVHLRAGEAGCAGVWGPLVGAWDDARFAAHDVQLEDGDMLVLYTDGVLDARRGVERFEEERLHEALRPAASAQDAVRRVEAALDAFQTGEQADDTAILAIGLTAVSAAAGPAPELSGPRAAPRPGG